MSDDTIIDASVTQFAGKTLSQFSSLPNMKSTTASNLPSSNNELTSEYKGFRKMLLYIVSLKLSCKE